MHDFNCTDADDMNFDLMAERTRYLKENEEGVSEMCKILEDMRDKAVKETAEKAASNLLKLGKISYEDIAECTGLSLEEVKILAEQSVEFEPILNQS